MTDTNQTTELEKLIQENESLKAELLNLQHEHSIVVITVIKTLKSVGLWPIQEGDNLTAKAIKGVKSVITESMINPGKLADRFSFIKDIVPLCEKYKNIQV